MSEVDAFEARRIKAESKSQKAKRYNNPWARLIYYINSVEAVLDQLLIYVEPEDYKKITDEDKEMILKYAELLTPKKLIEIGAFVKSDSLNCANDFFEITDENIRGLKTRDLEVGEYKFRITTIMAFREKWMEDAYYTPLKCVKLLNGNFFISNILCFEWSERFNCDCCFKCTDLDGLPYVANLLMAIFLPGYALLLLLIGFCEGNMVFKSEAVYGLLGDIIFLIVLACTGKI